MSDETPTEPTPPTPAAETPAGDKPNTWLPDDHPVVKSMQAMRAELHEAQRAAKANADAAIKLQEIEDAAKSQADKEADARAAAEQRAAKAEADYLRLKVATTKGIPADLADLLVGADEAEMTAVADRLLAMKAPTPPAPGSADAGPLGAAKPGQLSRADLQKLTPEQILEAKANGQLSDLLGTT